jgi:potassium voltage-gated channel Shaker-related subfamily A protein 2
MEYILRFLTSTAFEKKFSDFVLSPMNLVDLVAILPFLLGLFIESGSFRQLRIIRAVRYEFKF